jgi:hypothetical protein
MFNYYSLFSYSHDNHSKEEEVLLPLHISVDSHNIVMMLSVTVDGVWIGDWIY